MQQVLAVRQQMVRFVLHTNSMDTKPPGGVVARIHNGEHIHTNQVKVNENHFNKLLDSSTCTVWMEVGMQWYQHCKTMLQPIFCARTEEKIIAPTNSVQHPLQNHSQHYVSFPQAELSQLRHPHGH
eukprot:scpid10636/ scgid13528/ 